MDINQYIESGILETYLMGLATEQEKKEVECLSKIYPEIKEELSLLEDVLQLSTTINTINPPLDIKNKLMATIDITPQNIASIEQNNALKFNSVESSRSNELNDKIETKIIKMIPQSRVFAIAALLLLLIGAITIIVFNQNNKTMEQLVAQHNKEIDEINAQLSKVNELMQNTNKELAYFKNADFKKIILGGTEANNPNGKAVVSWNPNERVLAFSAEALPTPPNDKQYQLWAISDGVPVDLGVINKDLALGQTQQVKLQELKNVSAFAVTLEKNGGVPSPTLEQLFLIGEVKV